MTTNFHLLWNIDQDMSVKYFAWLVLYFYSSTEAYHKVSTDLLHHELGLESLYSDHNNDINTEYNEYYVNYHTIKLVKFVQAHLLKHKIINFDSSQSTMYEEYKHYINNCNTLFTLRYSSSNICYVHFIEHYAKQTEFFAVELGYESNNVNISIHALDMIYSPYNCRTGHLLMMSKGKELFR